MIYILWYCTTCLRIYPTNQLTGKISRTSRRDFPFETQVSRFLSTSHSLWRSSNDCGDRIDVTDTPRYIPQRYWAARSSWLRTEGSDSVFYLLHTIILTSIHFVQEKYVMIILKITLERISRLHARLSAISKINRFSLLLRPFSKTGSLALCIDGHLPS